MSKVKVSVIIPVYNAEKYLADTLDSVRMQSLKDIEILCIDDGSTDGSVEVLKEYAEQDNRIKILYQTEESKGAALARNVGLENARGEYLSILDADDLFRSDMLELLYNKLTQTKAQIVMCNAYEYDGDKDALYPVDSYLRKQYLPDKEVFSGRDVKDHLMQIKYGNAWNCMFLRSFIEENKIRFRNVRFNDDAEFVYIALALATRITTLDQRLVYYRVSSVGSQTATRSRYSEIGYLCNYYLKRELESRGLYEQFKESYVNRAMQSAAGHLSIIEEYSVAKELYEELKNKYIVELGAYDIADENYYDQRMVKFRDRIMASSSYDDYNFMCTRASSLSSDYAFRIPSRIARNSKGTIQVVIYGAGNYGKRLFSRMNNKKNELKVVAWVDRNYEDKDELVCSPEVISNLDYDMIIIAIKSESICEEVSEYLLSLGIREEKIVRMIDL